MWLVGLFQCATFRSALLPAHFQCSTLLGWKQDCCNKVRFVQQKAWWLERRHLSWYRPVYSYTPLYPYTPLCFNPNESRRHVTHVCARWIKGLVPPRMSQTCQTSCHIPITRQHATRWRSEWIDTVDVYHENCRCLPWELPCMAYMKQTMTCHDDMSRVYNGSKQVISLQPTSLWRGHTSRTCCVPSKKPYISSKEPCIRQKSHSFDRTVLIGAGYR